MPVPAYFKEIAYSEKNKNKTTEFLLKCNCGCTLFNVFESYMNKKELCKPYYDALEYSLKGGCFSSCTKDENGVLHHWIYLTHSRNGPKEEVFIPPKPVCAKTNVIKIKCSKCEKEFSIFDSRYSGYNGKFCNTVTEEEKEYIPHFKQKKINGGLPSEICISVEHDAYPEEFEKNTGISCAYEDYTDAYTWIAVYFISKDLKKRKIFDFETD
jgi:hypothetical protein